MKNYRFTDLPNLPLPGHSKIYHFTDLPNLPWPEELRNLSSYRFTKFTIARRAFSHHRTYRNWPPVASRVTCQRCGAGFLAQEKKGCGQLSDSCVLFWASEGRETDVFDFGLWFFAFVREVWVHIHPYTYIHTDRQT